jgi:phosphoribosylaminoimidazole-succinocarboxamide synthase
MRPLYEGKSKAVYLLPEGSLLLVFKDEITAFDGTRRDVVPGKGVLAASLSALLFEYLRGAGVDNHFIRQPGGNAIEARRADAIPLEVIVRFRAYGSYLKRMPLVKPLQTFREPVVEFHYKSDELRDPLLLPRDILESGLMSEAELAEAERLAVAAARALRELYGRVGCDLIDVKFEVGRLGGRLLIIDEISGDTFRLLCDGEHLDKEYYRKTGDAGGLLKRYEELLRVTREALGLGRQ